MFSKSRLVAIDEIHNRDEKEDEKKVKEERVRLLGSAHSIATISHALTHQYHRIDTCYSKSRT